VGGRGAGAPSIGEPCVVGGPVPGAAALVDDAEAVYTYCEVGAGGWKYDSNYTEIVPSHNILQSSD